MSSMQSPYVLLLASWLWAKYASNLRQLRSERSRLPSLSYHNTNTELRTIIESNLTVLLEYKFSALLGLLDYYGEYQGVYTMFMRKVFPPKPEYDRELLKLKDGGTVGLDWLQAPGKDDSNVPIVILQHGLCGHTYSHYMKGQPEVLTEAGLYVCSFVARGCGGVPLTTPETFTAARTNDFRAVVQYIAHKYPDRKIAAVGYSLGAGLLLKYLGEEGQNCPLSAAVAISPAYDFHDRTHLFAKYERMGMVKGLVNLVKNHQDFLQYHKDSCLDWDGMINCRTVREFDQAAIVGRPPNRGSARVGMEAYGTSSPDKLTGNRREREFLHFATVDDYYTASSCKHYIRCITTPTLAISARDDFLSAHTSVPTKTEDIGIGMCVLMTPHGGHVSFSDRVGCAAGSGPASCWSDRVSAAWIHTCCTTGIKVDKIEV